jgi:hypothetical protein
MVPKIQTERQARALANVPKDKRPEVLKEAEKYGKLTARSITEAAKKRASKTTKPERPKDKVGYEIPERAWAIWDRRNESREKLRPLYELKQWATDMQGSTDIFYRARGFNFGDIARDTGQLIYKIQQAIPDVVCTKCQGVDPECDFCYGRGMISIELAKSVTPIEMLKIRDKMTSDDSSEKLSVSGR